MKHPSTELSDRNYMPKQINRALFPSSTYRVFSSGLRHLKMEKCRVSAAPLSAKSLATKGTCVPAIPICKVESRNVPQKKPNHEGNRNSPKFRPRAVLSSPENDHLIGGEDMRFFKGTTELSQKMKIGCPCTANFGKEAFVKKSALKHSKTLGLPIKKDQAPVA